MKEVIVRFAPSPTGDLHIGGVRTAIYNWLFARQHKGRFLLRIEDTDTDRSTEESINQILESMQWLGLDWDGEVERQTDRLDIYKEAVNRLLKQGDAYYCYCTPEELEARRQEARANKLPPRYNGKCRGNLSVDSSRPHVVRFRMPNTGSVVIDDMVRGGISFENKQLDDMIIMRSNGVPTYNLCVVVDDALMNISHVFRGDDHINNTPRQIHIFKALGYELPHFAHLPMILGSDRARLSKRHGASSVLEYRRLGYLPDAVINYMVRLGWSCGDQEIFNIPELVDKFTTKNLSRSAAVFNPEKMLWVNAQHIHGMDTGKLVSIISPILKEERLVDFSATDQAGLHDRLVEIFTPLKERARTIPELIDSCRYFFTDDYSMDEKAAKKFLKQAAGDLLSALLLEIEKMDDCNYNKEALELIFHTVTEHHEVKLGKLAQPTRVALTGRTVSPGIFEVMELLGREKVQKRLACAIERITSNSL